jgi:hypothetical protein
VPLSTRYVGDTVEPVATVARGRIVQTFESKCFKVVDLASL